MIQPTVPCHQIIKLIHPPGAADGDVAFEDSENEWEDVPQAKASDQDPPWETNRSRINICFFSSHKIVDKGERIHPEKKPIII